MISGCGAPRPETIDLVTVIEEFIGLIRKKFSDQGIEVQADYKTDAAWVRADKDHLVQVFLNIALNSLQAMGDGGGRFHLRLLEKENVWQIEIEDTGKGIPESQIQWIFDPLFSPRRKEPEWDWPSPTKSSAGTTGEFGRPARCIRGRPSSSNFPRGEGRRNPHDFTAVC